MIIKKISVITLFSIYTSNSMLIQQVAGRYRDCTQDFGLLGCDSGREIAYRIESLRVGL